MPLPLAPLLPIALRLGAVAVAGYAAQRMLTARPAPGRTDQQAEDALDALPDGVTSHRPRDVAGQQHNTTWRMRRKMRVGGRVYEVDTAAVLRIKIQEVE